MVLFYPFLKEYSSHEKRLCENIRLWCYKDDPENEEDNIHWCSCLYEPGDIRVHFKTIGLQR